MLNLQLKICWKYDELYVKYAEYAQKYALKYVWEKWKKMQNMQK